MRRLVVLYIGALSSWRLRRNKSFRFPLQIILRPVLIVVVTVVAVVDLVVVYLITRSGIEYSAPCFLDVYAVMMLLSEPPQINIS